LCAKGPPMARVDAVKDEPVQSRELDLRYPGERFSILPTI
jgi:acylphosphatase